MAIFEVEESGVAPQHEIDWNFPLWSEILSGLWLGGTDDFDTIEYEVDSWGPREITKNEFEVVVTLYAWARPVDWFVEEVRYGFYDDSASDNFDEAALLRAAKYAHEQWKSGKKVLVRCQAGINRSGLVMGIVLMMEGFTAEQAIEMMRTKRSSSVLINKSFENYLKELKLND